MRCGSGVNVLVDDLRHGTDGSCNVGRRSMTLGRLLGAVVHIVGGMGCYAVDWLYTVSVDDRRLTATC